MQPLADRPIEFARIERRQVSKDCFISFDGVKYSVPWEHVKKEIEVRATSTEVQLFTSRGSLIKSHRKMPESFKTKYSYVVDKEDFIDLLADNVQITQGIIKSFVGRIRGLMTRVTRNVID